MPTRRRRTYPRTEQLAAVVEAEGPNGVEGAAERLGIPARNIYRWREDPAMAEYVAKTRDALVDDIRIAAAVAWDELIKRIRSGDIETRDLIVAAGVAIDKGQLLSGGATSRTESRDLTGTLSDAELDRAIAEAQALVRGEALPADGGAAPEVARD